MHENLINVSFITKFILIFYYQNFDNLKINPLLNDYSNARTNETEKNSFITKVKAIQNGRKKRHGGSWDHSEINRSFKS